MEHQPAHELGRHRLADRHHLVGLGREPVDPLRRQQHVAPEAPAVGVLVPLVAVAGEDGVLRALDGGREGRDLRQRCAGRLAERREVPHHPLVVADDVGRAAGDRSRGQAQPASCGERQRWVSPTRRRARPGTGARLRRGRHSSRCAGRGFRPTGAGPWGWRGGASSRERTRSRMSPRRTRWISRAPRRDAASTISAPSRSKASGLTLLAVVSSVMWRSLTRTSIGAPAGAGATDPHSNPSRPPPPAPASLRIDLRGGRGASGAGQQLEVQQAGAGVVPVAVARARIELGQVRGGGQRLGAVEVADDAQRRLRDTAASGAPSRPRTSAAACRRGWSGTAPRELHACTRGPE